MLGISGKGLDYCRCMGLMLAGLWLPLAWAGEPVILQLKWQHGFQFAGYYAALEQGYYQQAGLDVELRVAKPDLKMVSAVVSGQADYGIGMSSLLVARAQGEPVVVLANIFQHSPKVLLARADALPRGSSSLISLIGQSMMLEDQSDELVAYLHSFGLGVDDFQQQAHSHTWQDLANGKTALMSAYLSTEPYYLRRAGVDFVVFNPRAHGISFYGDNLFTRQSLVEQNPNQVAAMLAASLEGWRYALEHPEEMIAHIIEQYDASLSPESLRFEYQQLLPLLWPEIVDIGYMSPERWRQIYLLYADMGLVSPDFSWAGFLYQPPEREGYPIWWLVFSLAALTLISLISLYIYRINVHLQQAMKQQQLTEQQLRDSEELHRLLADNASDVIWTMDLDGAMTYISPSVLHLRGFTQAQARQQSLGQSLTTESLTVFTQALASMRRQVSLGIKVEDHRLEVQQLCFDGRAQWVEMTLTGIYDSQQQFKGILGVSREIGQRKAFEQQMQRMAHFDPLTQLPNRILFYDRLEQALATAKREGHRLAVIFIDLDHFKPINDSHGHAMGDKVLQQLALRLHDAVRACDSLGRMGGDEFVVMLGHIHDVQDASLVATKLQAVLSTPMIIEGHKLTLGASLGIAIYPEHGTGIEELVTHADQAMYGAKQTGGQGFQYYQRPSSTAPAHEES